MRIESADSPASGADPLAGRRILVGISGSIAAVKIPLVVSALAQRAWSTPSRTWLLKSQ